MAAASIARWTGDTPVTMGLSRRKVLSSSARASGICNSSFSSAFISPSFLLAGEKSYDFSANWFAVGCAHPSGALATEKYFSDVHAAGKMIEIFCAVRGANSAKLFTR